VTWTYTRLKHLCVDPGQYGLNVSALDYASSGYRLIRISDIDEAGRLRSHDDAIFVDVRLDPRHQLKTGDLLLARSGATVGRAMLTGELEEPSTYAGYLVRFRPLRSTEPRFLAYFAASHGFQTVIESDAVISTIQNFNAERYANIPLSVPPLDDQRRIADFLDAEMARIDQLMAARRAQGAILCELWDSRLAAAIDELTRTHGRIPLRRLVTSVEQGWSPQCEDVIAEPDEWAVLKTSAVSSGEFAPLEHKRLPTGIGPNLRYQVRDGDILLTRGSGSPHNVGVAALANTEKRHLLLSDLLYRIRLESGWSPEFAVLALRSQPVRGLMGFLFRGQSGQTIKLRAEDVRSIEIPAVPASSQPKIAAELLTEQATIRGASQSLEASLSLLAERRQALITAAVTGQIDVSTAGRGATG
jgi:type I restriction enzyme S subunit